MKAIYRLKIEYTSEDLVIRYPYLIGRFIEYILKIHDLQIQNSTNIESIKQVYYINALNALKKWERLRGLRDATPNRKIGECDLAEVYHTKDDYVFTAFKKQDEYINLLINKHGSIQLHNIPSIINMLEKQITYHV